MAEFDSPRAEDDLLALADKIRRQPRIAQEMDVSVLVQELTGRWRQYRDMMDASEEVPVAAWIVRRKVEGLVRPDADAEEVVAFDPDLRPDWLGQAVELLQDAFRQGAAFMGRPTAVNLRPQPAPVKDPSLWKLAWSYPKLRVKPQPPIQTVQREPLPLRQFMYALLERLGVKRRLVLHEELAGRSRQEWTASFLAAVHLWHERQVELNQAVAYGPLLVETAVGPRDGDQ